MSSEKIFKIYIFLLFGVLPLVSFAYFRENFEYPKVLIFILATLLFLGLLAGSVTKLTKIVNKGLTIGKILLLGLGLMGLTTFFSADIRNSFWGQYYRYQGLVTWICLGVYYLIISRPRFNQLIRSWGWVLGLPGKVTAVIMIGQAILFYGGINIYNFWGRMTGLMGNPNFAGALIVLSMAYTKIGWWTGVMGIGVILSQSRSALMALIVVLGVRAIQNGKKRLGGIVIITSLIVTGVISVIKPISAFDNRWIIWQKAVAAAISRPLSGWGLENFDLAFKSTLEENDFDLKTIRVDKAHNEFLEYWVALGVGGLIWFGILNWQAGTYLSRDRSKWGRSNFACLVGFLIVSFFNPVNINAYLFYLLALSGAGQISDDKSLSSA